MTVSIEQKGNRIIFTRFKIDSGVIIDYLVYLFIRNTTECLHSIQVVMFNLEVGEAPNKPSSDKEDEVNHNKLEDMIKELATTLKTVMHEQEYMQVKYSVMMTHTFC